MADYSQEYNRIVDANHGSDFFKYGHVGKFDVYQTNSYAYDPASGRHVHNGWQDTLVTFEASEYNPELAAINNQYFSLFDNNTSNLNFGGGPGEFVVTEEVEAGPYSSLLEVQNGNALLNGQSAASTYRLWSYYGNQGGTYRINNNAIP